MDAVTISDVDQFLQALSDDAPCGPDLEYDPAFLAFSQACTVKPEAQYGDTISPEVPPEWKTVLRLALQLLARTRDLRLCVPFTRALLHMQGLPGLALGLRLTEQLLDLYWDSVHPQLDPDDGNDPMMRVNTLASLCEGAVVLREILEAVLLDSRIHGRFTVRDMDIATGETEVADDVPKVSLGLIDAAFTDADLDELQALSASIQSACDSVARIEVIVTEQVGAAQALDMSPLLKIVKRAHGYVADRLQVRLGGNVYGASADNDEEGAQIIADGSMTKTIRDEISDRNDVMRVLDKICDYYSEHEPSSPVPLLLMRAKRMVTMNFLEIIEHLAPEGLNQVYSVSGVQESS